MLLFALGLSGCNLVQRTKGLFPDKTPVFKPTNVYASADVDQEIKRVVVLPIFSHAPGPDLAALDALFAGELNKTLLFEVIAIDREELARMAGKSQIASVELLPPALLHILQTTYAAQAVLFTDLTYYDPYKPISIGVRCKLASLDSGDILWAIDHLFDSSHPSVAKAATQYFEQVNGMRHPISSSRNSLNSPQRFSQYVAYAVFETLPVPAERSYGTINEGQ